MEKIIYFDHGATTKVDERVLNKMIPYFSLNYGNPSSSYYIGRKNKRAIENAREQISYIISAKPKEIYFTSCGSESDNLAIKGIAYANISKGRHIITSRIEHPAVLNTCLYLEKRGFEITYLNVDKNGFIRLEELKNKIREDTILITIMFANNEIGTIQEVKEIGKIAKENNIYFHTDAVQAIGNVKIDVNKMNIDLLSMSAHKFYGPKGVGALYVRKGIEFERQQDGGHQENGKRAGTENIAGIVGIGEAIKYSYYNFDEKYMRTLKLKNYFIEKLKQINSNIKINGDLENRLPGNINVSFLGYDSTEILMRLDEYGICASAGSACSTGDTKPSHVLTALGLNKEQIEGTIRFTLGKENTKQEIDYTIGILKKIFK